MNNFDDSLQEIRQTTEDGYQIAKKGGILLYHWPHIVIAAVSILAKALYLGMALIAKAIQNQR